MTTAPEHDWQSRYTGKVTSAEEAVRLIPAHQRILIGSGAAEPGRVRIDVRGRSEIPKMAYIFQGVANRIATDDEPLVEITPSLTYHVMSEQHDQVTVIKPGTGTDTGRVIRSDVQHALD